MTASGLGQLVRLTTVPGDCSLAAAALSGPRCLQVMIWDDHQKRCIGELSFRSQVRLPAAVPLSVQPWPAVASGSENINPRPVHMVKKHPAWWAGRQAASVQRSAEVLEPSAEPAPGADAG